MNYTVFKTELDHFEKFYSILTLIFSLNENNKKLQDALNLNLNDINISPQMYNNENPIIKYTIELFIANTNAIKSQLPKLLLEFNKISPSMFNDFMKLLLVTTLNQIIESLKESSNKNSYLYSEDYPLISEKEYLDSIYKSNSEKDVLISNNNLNLYYNLENSHFDYFFNKFQLVMRDSSYSITNMEVLSSLNELDINPILDSVLNTLSLFNDINFTNDKISLNEKLFIQRIFINFINDLGLNNDFNNLDLLKNNILRNYTTILTQNKQQHLDSLKYYSISHLFQEKIMNESLLSVDEAVDYWCDIKSKNFCLNEKMICIYDIAKSIRFFSPSDINLLISNPKWKELYSNYLLDSNQSSLTLDIEKIWSTYLHQNLHLSKILQFSAQPNLPPSKHPSISYRTDLFDKVVLSPIKFQVFVQHLMPVFKHEFNLNIQVENEKFIFSDNTFSQQNIQEFSHLFLELLCLFSKKETNKFITESEANKRIFFNSIIEPIYGKIESFLMTNDNKLNLNVKKNVKKF